MRTMLRLLLAGVVVVHGLLHLLGAVKGFGWAEISALTQPIGPAMAAVWLAAAALVIAAGLMLASKTRGWWVAAIIAAGISQAAVLTAWQDAKAGTLVNLILLLAGGYGYASRGPASFLAQYERARRAAHVPIDAEVVTETDLETLPGPVATYLRRAGAVGQPRVTHFSVMSSGRIRGGPAKPWMTFTGRQFNTYGPGTVRLFHMDATMFGLPVDVLHIFDERGATMRAKVLSVVPIVNAAGPEMDRAETVTLFNDLCVLAPAALVDAPVSWQLIDDRRVRGTYTRGTQTVTAELVFDEQGDLVDFVSDDRLRAAPGGKSFRRQSWSTPVGGYRAFGPRRLGTKGEGLWAAPAPEGEFTYLEFQVDDVTYNPTSRRAPETAGPRPVDVPVTARQ